GRVARIHRDPVPVADVPDDVVAPGEVGREPRGKGVSREKADGSLRVVTGFDDYLARVLPEVRKLGRKERADGEERDGGGPGGRGRQGARGRQPPLAQPGPRAWPAGHRARGRPPTAERGEPAGEDDGREQHDQGEELDGSSRLERRHD